MKPTWWMLLFLSAGPDPFWTYKKAKCRNADEAMKSVTPTDLQKGGWLVMYQDDGWGKDPLHTLTSYQISPDKQVGENKGPQHFKYKSGVVVPE